jgi:hypothetical protein
LLLKVTCENIKNECREGLLFFLWGKAPKTNYKPRGKLIQVESAQKGKEIKLATTLKNLKSTLRDNSCFANQSATWFVSRRI